MTIEDSGSALPRVQREQVYRSDPVRPTVNDMSLRDWFAGQALTGMCGGSVWPRPDDGPEAARRAYLMADAMLQERAK